jgi:phosphate uptake regulator
MNRDAAGSLVDGDLQLAKSVVARDDESDRQYFLLVRVLRSMVQDSGLGETLGLTALDCLDYRLAASFVEAVGDASVQVANQDIALNGVKLSEELKNLLVNLQAVCGDACDKALKAFVGKDVALAENVGNMRDKVDDVSMESEKAARTQPVEVMARVLAAAALLKSVYSLSVNLADLVV